ncbi:MmgE/PrpD family protein [Melioribacter sp. OK-6-Me]|uniref:MmgE/PrpD family protein n=1 Tax=unclassified Melioribacter TaxID=2627329 RepID=UPI003EDA7682
MEKSVSRIISEFAIDLKYEDIPAEVIYEAKRYLYDSIGCAYGAYETKDVNIIRNYFRNIGGRQESTVIAFGDKLPSAHAAFVNSQMIRSLDFNDIYWKQDPSHPSDLIPAALAVGEFSNASMKSVLTAIVLGYEFEQRLCEIAFPGIRERKWHHATLTQFVSPIVAGKLLNLDVDQMVNAIGINGSHNFTSGAPASGQLSMMKNTVDPMAVFNGVISSFLAKEGFSGPEFIFEGKEGLFDCMLGWDYKSRKSKPVSIPGLESYGEWQWKIENLFNDLGTRYKILECSMKAFPTEALTHTHISAVLSIVNKYDIQPEEIEKITVTTIARVCDILFDPQKYKPKSRETADHSLPYCIAVAIVDRKITTDSFSEEKIKDPRIWSIIDKIEGVASHEFEKLFPEKQPSKVSIVTKDGKEYSEYLEYPKGHPQNPMTDDELETKFNSLSSKVLSTQKQKEIKELVYNCEKMEATKFMNNLIV